MKKQACLHEYIFCEWRCVREDVQISVCVHARYVEVHGPEGVVLAPFLARSAIFPHPLLTNCRATSAAPRPAAAMDGHHRWDVGATIAR